MSLFGSGRREGLLAVLTLLLMSIALHAPGLFLGMPRGPAPDTPAMERSREAFTNQDTVMPALRAAGDVVRGGEAPLWNPRSRLGEPFLESGAPVLYPPFWLLMLDGGANILDLVLCLHTFLAAMFMFRFCRILPLSRYVAFLAGSLYGLGWFLTAQHDRLPDAAAAALLPLAMEFTKRVVLSRNRGVYAGWLSVVVAGLFSTGGTGVAVMGVLLITAMFIRGVLALDRESQFLACRSAFATTVLAVLLTAPMWIHHLVHSQSLVRAESPKVAHLQVGGLLGALSPTAFGGLSGKTPESLQMVNPAADPLELVLFPGSIILFLGLLGLFRPKRTAIGLFWIAVGGVGVLLSLDGPVADSLARFAPWAVTSPGMALVLVNLAFVILGAAALESFFEAPQARRFAVPIAAWTTLTVCACVLLIGFVVPSLGASLVANLVSGTSQDVLAALEHLRFALLPTTLFCAAIAVFFLIWRRMGLLRFKLVLELLVIAELLMVALVHTPRSEATHRESFLSGRIPESSGRAILVGRDARVQADALRNIGTPTITTTAPSILSRTRDLLVTIDPSMVLVDNKARVLPLQTAPLLSRDLLDIMGVGIALTGSPEQFHGFSMLMPRPMSESHRENTSYLHFRVEEPRRARVLFRAEHAVSRADASTLVLAHGHRLTNTVILERSDPEFEVRRPDDEPAVTFVEDGANRIRLSVDMGQGRGYLLLADAYAPGWKASVDGAPTPIHPANLALRAIALTEGKHEIVLRYRPWMGRLGAPIAAFGFLLVLSWLLIPGMAMPRRPPTRR